MKTTLMAVCMSLAAMACTVSTTPPGNGATGAQANGAPASEAATLDAQIVGDWFAGRGGTTVSYDRATGTFGSGSGGAMLFQFKADGSYVRAVRSIEDGPCTMGYVSTDSGSVTTVGSELHLHPTHGNLHTISCSGGADTDKPLEVHDETLTWSVAPFSQDPSTPALTLTNADGATAELRKAQ